MRIASRALIPRMTIRTVRNSTRRAMRIRSAATTSSAAMEDAVTSRARTRGARILVTQRRHRPIAWPMTRVALGVSRAVESISQCACQKALLPKAPVLGRLCMTGSAIRASTASRQLRQFVNICRDAAPLLRELGFLDCQGPCTVNANNDRREGVFLRPYAKPRSFALQIQAYRPMPATRMC
ncbi:hypothetical protein DIPPA_62301 [Diplonema papillatum]|nr:hypothetical protein DIPPA_62301 [Diplonema papillatum]